MRTENDLIYIEKCQRRALDLNLPQTEAHRNKELLDNAIKESKQDLLAYQSHLSVLEKELTEYQKGSSDYVMCANHISKLRKKYYQFLNRLYSLQKGFTERKKERLLKEMQVIDPSATEEDLYVMTSRPLFKQNVLQSIQYHGEYALTQVKERHEELHRLEASVEELAEMMTELSMHIHHQDTYIDQVTHEAQDVLSHLEYGDHQIEEAIKKRQSGRRCKWILCVLLTLILLGVLFYILFGVLQLHTKMENSSISSLPDENDKASSSTTPQNLNPPTSDTD
ncbi:Syntaxin-2 [Coelomomyces lativittatus]|nr:Syntaxin-2 [Coelomomyces lativittatus]KAJ1502693.1 Syntaxin-2 [Coelomomyces lativittatus]